ncbi:hypothetical protein RhiirC2_797537 [Rhizophagus irregularis]|uniref:Uncharacterized protein n=1 Tax=Rhizophagus irregularis TaxID=588596 RepID=A0A2N1M7V9_9GLOM|nr:hypothetical protein RhiirC2_797537 [Rhizophagus irregularis]
MLLVEGFSESKYLQKRIKQEFGHQINDISVPTQTMAEISHGANMQLYTEDDYDKGKF